MAIDDILAQSGDGQDFVVEIPAGNAAYTPADVLIEDDGSILLTEVPAASTPSGGNIFIMSE